MIAARPWPFLLALAAACGGGALPSAGPAPATHASTRTLTPFRYRPGGPYRYTYRRIDSLTASLPNGGQQQQVVERLLQLRWEATAAPNGLQITVTVDSIHVSGPGARAIEDSSRGAIFRGRLSPEGRLDSLTLSADNAIDRTLRANLPWLFPIFPASTAEGASVEDTLVAIVPLGLVDVTERTERRVVAGASIGVFALSGVLSQQGMSPQVTLSSSGTRGGSVEVDPSGHIARLSGRDSVAMQVVAAATGQGVQFRQITTYSLVPLP